jgi:hypothetical protein
LPRTERLDHICGLLIFFSPGDRRRLVMASTGAQETFPVPSVLAAMLTMRTGDAEKKKAAVDFLARFQKSVRSLPCSLWPHHC